MQRPLDRWLQQVNSTDETYGDIGNFSALSALIIQKNIFELLTICHSQTFAVSNIITVFLAIAYLLLLVVFGASVDTCTGHIYG